MYQEESSKAINTCEQKLSYEQAFNQLLKKIDDIYQNEILTKNAVQKHHHTTRKKIFHYIEFEDQIIVGNKYI